ncbi:MAG TPA: glycosyltransferase family 2 protein, partial [Tepidisphaeraceae bacterium]|nr:glycosyltransferase family 2 protein [Tepidisphaeraceae bacterium]
MISVVVPIYNEQENLPELRKRMTAALDSSGEKWECVLVNDGSRDRSVEIITKITREDPRFKLVNLSRNFGHQPAVTAGVHHATGDAVILIDGDLQDPPEVIPDMVKSWKEGGQVVVAERRTRADSGLRGLGFKLFYPIMRRLTELPNVPDAGIFCLMDRAVVNEFNKLPERNRFIPGLRLWLGFKQTTVHYDRQERAAGKPKQSFRRLFHYALNGIVSFSYRPLRAATYMGFLVSIFGFLTAAYFIIKRLAGDETAVTGFTTLLCAIIFLGGVQLISVGILGEYIGRIY